MSETSWIEGAWNGMEPVGLPKEAPGEPDIFVWIVIEHQFSWGQVHVGTVHSMTTVLRSTSAFQQAVNRPPGRWAWQRARSAPDQPAFQEKLRDVEDRPNLSAWLDSPVGRSLVDQITPRDSVLRSVTAQLATVSSPLRLLHGPILVTVETWSDGMVQARWPETTLYGEGETDIFALHALRERMLDFAKRLVALGPAELAGPLHRQWLAFRAMVDVSELGLPSAVQDSAVQGDFLDEIIDESESRSPGFRAKVDDAYHRRDKKSRDAHSSTAPSVPLDPHNGHLDPAYFVAVHKERIRRLEEVLAFVVSLRPLYAFAPYDAARVDKLLWGFPCAGCGCAESLCCCAQEEP
jgi:hypothetical protein